MTLQGNFLKIIHHQNQTIFQRQIPNGFPGRSYSENRLITSRKTYSAERNLCKVANSYPLKHLRGDFFFLIKMMFKTLISNMFES